MAVLTQRRRKAVADATLLKELVHGDPGAMDRIRDRYSLTMYALAYGELMDSKRSGEVVSDALADCARAASLRELGAKTLLDELVDATRRMMSRAQTDDVTRPAPAERSWRVP